MYNNNYEEYMREVLGYNTPNQRLHNEIYYQNYFSNPINSGMQLHQTNQMPPNYLTRNFNNMLQSNIEDLYPDVYKMLNPVVSRICKKNTKPITEESLEEMVSEVYNTVNIDDINIVNINVQTKGDIKQSTTNIRESKELKDIRDSRENREIRDNRETRENRDIRDNKENKENRDVRKRPSNNPIIRDLIKILILNQLLNRNFRRF